MPLVSGTELGPYEILAAIGAGGGGDAYRARDGTPKRDDPERVSGFQGETQVPATLNHSNIASIYEIEEASSSHFLVREFVDGENAGPIKARCAACQEALQFAKEICEALEAARGKKIVHRDLEPARISAPRKNRLRNRLVFRRASLC